MTKWKNPFNEEPKKPKQPKQNHPLQPEKKTPEESPQYLDDLLQETNLRKRLKEEGWKNIHKYTLSRGRYEVEIIIDEDYEQNTYLIMPKLIINNPENIREHTVEPHTYTDQFTYEFILPKIFKLYSETVQRLHEKEQDGGTN